MSKILLFIIPIAFIGFIFFLMSGSSQNNTSNNSGNVKGATMQGDTQIIEIVAKGGYSPRVVNAKANTKTTLNMKTINTYDCSSALIIKDLGVNDSLPQNGIKSYTIPPQKSGTVISGNCSMGMNGFKIKFN